MLNNTAKEMISSIQVCLKNQPVDKAWLFGSYSRGFRDLKGVIPNTGKKSYKQILDDYYTEKYRL